MGTRRGQGGFALIEAIASLLLLVVGMTALLSAVMSIIVMTKAHRDRVRSGIEAVGIAEAFNKASYVPCQKLADKRTALGYPKAVDGFNLNITRVQYLAQQASNTASWIEDQAACVAAGDQGLQRIEISVKRPDGRGIETLWFVVRNDICPATVTTVAGERC